MGGFTQIFLRDCSQQNIDAQNQILDDLKVPKRYRFYSEKDVKEEYEYFIRKEGVFPEHLFPSDKIHSYADFTKYWSTKALGSVFAPPFGSLQFDCYFGRTSNRAMHLIARYLLEAFYLGESRIKNAEGSYTTFVERCGYKTKTKQTILLSLE